MKKCCFLFFVSVFIICFNLKIESRQYNIDYLIDLVERGDEEGVKQFFSAAKPVTKFKHVVDFTESFCEKLEERFGYKPSYREAYDFFKASVNSMDFPKKQKKQLRTLFKELVKQSEKAEKRGYKLSSITMDFKGSTDSDFDMPDELAIAYNEALGGCLICIIPSPVSIAIGGVMIGDALKRTYDYLDNKSSDRDYSDYNIDPDTSYRDCDRDSWDREY